MLRFSEVINHHTPRTANAKEQGARNQLGVQAPARVRSLNRMKNRKPSHLQLRAGYSEEGATENFRVILN